MYVFSEDTAVSHFPSLEYPLAFQRAVKNWDRGG